MASKANRYVDDFKDAAHQSISELEQAKRIDPQNAARNDKEIASFIEMRNNVRIK
jgi:hypothetical protein